MTFIKNFYHNLILPFRNDIDVINNELFDNGIPINDVVTFKLSHSWNFFKLDYRSLGIYCDEEPVKVIASTFPSFNELKYIRKLTDNLTLTATSDRNSFEICLIDFTGHDHYVLISSTVSNIDLHDKFKLQGCWDWSDDDWLLWAMKF